MTPEFLIVIVFLATNTICAAIGFASGWGIAKIKYGRERGRNRGGSLVHSTRQDWKRQDERDKELEHQLAFKHMRKEND